MLPPQATSTSVPPVIVSNSAKVVEKTAAGCPAAAQTVSCWRSHRRGMADGGDAADDLAGVATHEVGFGARQGTHFDALGERLSVDAMGARGEDQDRITVRVEEQTVGDGPDFTAQGSGRECSRVGAVGQDDHITGASAPGEFISK